MTGLGVGIIGCGNISSAYFELSQLFPGLRIVACADRDPAAAELQAARYGVRATAVDALLADPQVGVVVNLTVPAAHAEVTLRALDAGKHVFSEKPLCLGHADGLAIAAKASAAGLRVGCAPDTYLGAAAQAARALLDGGSIGQVTSGSVHVMSQGMEAWHPNPDFFFQPGGGPVFDLGIYHIAMLTSLLGPVSRVVSTTSTPRSERTIGSGPRSGERFGVSTPTTVHAILTFRQGATVAMSASWDVSAHSHPPIELYATGGTLGLPDPNYFGGPVTVTRPGGSAQRIDTSEHPFSRPNRTHGTREEANYRTAGLADMVAAIAENRPHRCALEFALHGVEVMEAILTAGDTGQSVAIASDCDRPKPLGSDAAKALMHKR